MSNVQDWSTTAASNNSASPNGFPEGMAPSGLNDSSREVMAAVKRMYLDINGSLTSAGTSNAYTLTSNSSLSAYSDGDVFMFEANHTNTGAATLNVDSVGAQSIVAMDGSALVGGEISSGGRYMVTYDAGNTNWMLVGVAASVNGNVTKAKTADTSRSSTSTLADDAHLAAFSLEAASYYKVTGHLRFTSSSATPDAKIALQTSAAFGNEGWLLVADSVGISANVSSGSSVVSYTIAVDASYTTEVTISGAIETVSAATVDLQWAQSTSNATATILEEGSWLSFEKVG